MRSRARNSVARLTPSRRSRAAAARPEAVKVAIVARDKLRQCERGAVRR